MQFKRVDATKLKAVVEESSRLFVQLEELLLPYLESLTDKERQETPKTRENFEALGPTFARSVAGFPKIVEASGCDPEALVEDLDNAKALAPVAERAAVLSRRLADTRLTWLAEAWVPSLTAYGVAKVLARTDGKVSEVVNALSPVFATRRSKKTEAPE